MDDVFCAYIVGKKCPERDEFVLKVVKENRRDYETVYVLTSDEKDLHRYPGCHIAIAPACKIVMHNFLRMRRTYPNRRQRCALIIEDTFVHDRNVDEHISWIFSLCCNVEDLNMDVYVLARHVSTKTRIMDHEPFMGWGYDRVYVHRGWESLAIDQQKRLYDRYFWESFSRFSDFASALRKNEHLMFDRNQRLFSRSIASW